ncbi:hypothetical protein [Hyphomicrobium sp. LHD-15]|uniref:hypothetical protein n=1 Tax=Hyphomicrobium sp. LHD-15 TaxID=3072142 RepID=UPI00280E06B1|nr:hypothetical protein [Hyphomicrobium sp. LHD-15]MDQ8699245.1 hypothetical protein [Hyphomicrobium sp. LHD-15]
MNDNDLKILGLIVGVWLVYCLGVFVAVLSGVDIGTDALELLKDGIPNWLQALGTVFAAYFAARALRAWRAQEEYRRKVTLADRLIVDVDAYMRDVRKQVELRLYDDPLTIAEAEHLVQTMEELAIRADERSGQVRAHLVLVKAVLGEEAGAQVSKIVGISVIHAAHIKRLKRLIKEYKQILAPGAQTAMLNEIKSKLERAGAYSLHGFGKLPPGGDRLSSANERELSKAYTTLDDMLVKILRA